MRNVGRTDEHYFERLQPNFVDDGELRIWLLSSTEQIPVIKKNKTEWRDAKSFPCFEWRVSSRIGGNWLFCYVM